MANFANPTVGSNYTDFPVEIRASVDAALQQLSVGSHTNIPTGAIKFDTSDNRWKKYNGSAFVDLTSTYDFNAALNATALDMGDSNNIQGGTNAIRLGISDDLRIFHDGSNSYIRDFSGTGNLKITTNQLDILNNNQTETLAKFIQDGSVELYENGTKRFETDGNGIQVTSRVGIGGTADRTLDVFGSGRIGASGTGDAELIIGRSGSGNRNAYIDWVGDNTYTDYGFRIIRKNGGPNTETDIAHRGTGALRLITQEAAEIQFHTTNTQKAVITSTGRLGVGVSNPTALLHVDSDSTTAGIRITGDGNSFLELDADSSVAGTQVAFIDFKLAGTLEANIAVNEGVSGNPLELNSATNHNIALATGGGNVGIGTNSPAGKLHISSGTSGDCELIIEADTDNNNESDNPRIIFRQDGGINASAIGHEDNELRISNSISSGGGISFRTSSTNGYTNAVERMKITQTGDITVPDNGKLVFGAGSDLQIYHDGSNNHIDCPSSGTGHLIIKADDFFVRGSNSEEMIKAYENGGVELYYNGNQKFVTTNTGVDATGSIQATSSVVAGLGGGGVALTINDGYGNANICFNHKSGTPEQNGNAGRIIVNTDSTSGANMLFQVKSNVTSGSSGGLTGVLALYETSVNPTVNVLPNTDSAINLGSTSKRWANGYFDALDVAGNLNLGNGDRVVWGTSDTAYIQGDDNNYLIFGVNNEKMRIHNDGQITIGATTISSGLAAVTSNFGQNGSDNMIGFMTYQNAHPNDTFNQAAIARSVASGETRDCHIGTYKVGGNNPAGYVFMHKRNGGNVYMWGDSSTRLRVATGVGNIGASAGTIVGTQTSDIRIKNNLGSISYGLAEINKITPIKFTYKDDDSSKQQIGFSAQDVQAIIPEAIYDTEDSREIDGTTIKNVLAMEYTSLIPVLVNAIKELSTEVNTLKAKIA